jgi:hypothetical protein
MPSSTENTCVDLLAAQVDNIRLNNNKPLAKTTDLAQPVPE